MIILRKGEKNKFKYLNYKGDEVKSIEMLDYIKKLVIPPNYIDVKIFYQNIGHPKILYQGFDSKNRLQRIYSNEWKNKALRRKFCELLNFSEQIQSMATEVKKQMSVGTHTKNKMIAIIIRIVMVCYFRIGNKRYKELYGSFGAMNIQSKHITFLKDANGEYMIISFSGKKKVINTCHIYDKTLISEIKKLLKFRDDDEMIFQWNQNGVKTPIRAIDINAWLKKFDPVITSKDFRTYDANIFLIIFLRKQKEPLRLTATSRKRVVVSAMKIISNKIHNTPPILKKNYTAGGIINLYINEPTKFMKYFINDKSPRNALVGYLRDYCKDYKVSKKEIIKDGGKAFRK
jgi:DNA topoisomerase-1